MSVDMPPILHMPLWRVERRLYCYCVKYVVQSFDFLPLWPVANVCSIRCSQAKCCSRLSVTLRTEKFEIKKNNFLSLVKPRQISGTFFKSYKIFFCEDIR